LEKERVIIEKQLKDAMHTILLSVMDGDVALVRALVLGTHFYVKPDANVLHWSDIVVENVKSRQGCLAGQPVTDGCSKSISYISDIYYKENVFTTKLLKRIYALNFSETLMIKFSNDNTLNLNSFLIFMGYKLKIDLFGHSG
jgi:hypothetical protein